MSQGMKNLQTASRSSARRDRMLAIDTNHTPSSTSPNQTYGPYHTDDSGYADDLEAEYDADNASDRSSQGQGQYGHYHSNSGGSGSGLGMSGGGGGSASMGGGGYYGNGRLPSMDMGIENIINRPGNGR